jgi:regulator of protease activity HflC (stomatin/prohibitin superfamily)
VQEPVSAARNASCAAPPARLWRRRRLHASRQQPGAEILREARPISRAGNAEARRAAGKPDPFDEAKGEEEMLRKFHVRKDERALLFRKGDFVTILDAGQHTLWDPLRRLSVETFGLGKTEFVHRLAEYLVKAEPELVAREFVVVALGAAEVGLRYENGVLVEVLAPNARRLYWKGYIDVRVDIVSIAEEFAIPQALARELKGANGVFAVAVPQYHVAVMYVDGKVSGLLEAGTHYFWKFGRELKTELVDTRLQVVEVAGQEILTRDKVTLRVNLTAGYRVADVLMAYAKQAKPVEYLYKELQFGLRAAVGTRTLDELLENKVVIDAVVSEHIARKVAGYGLEVESIGVKDIILPGEMKVILAKVVEAEKAAQANVIRRREETAATRSLLNTARVMEDNPVALRLKELESLEKVTEKIDKISVYGGLDSVLKDLVKIGK